jgi:enediyne biosynthesis protein E4
VLRVRTIGSAGNRDGIGARIDVTSGNGGRWWRLVKTGSSYASQSELPVTFGLGSATAIESIRITWPNGKAETVTGVAVDHAITVKEGAGLVEKTPIVRRGASTTRP